MAWLELFYYQSGKYWLIWAYCSRQFKFLINSDAAGELDLNRLCRDVRRGRRSANTVPLASILYTRLLFHSWLSSPTIDANHWCQADHNGIMTARGAFLVVVVLEVAVCLPICLWLSGIDDKTSFQLIKTYFNFSMDFIFNWLRLEWLDTIRVGFPCFVALCATSN